MKMIFKCHRSSRREPAHSDKGLSGLTSAATATRHSEQGMALVITLIMLSVTLIMAVAFLAISRRERDAVTSTTETATARLAADTALATAEAQIAATILATNLAAYDFKMLVSTNYQNSFGHVSGVMDPTNVNYDYLSSGGTLSAADFEQNTLNLLFLPRAPVAMITNQVTGGRDFRFFLDLNRNGRFETNGVVGEFDSFGTFTGNLATNTGDPEWIGILERPDAMHSANNKFVARYAFMAQPIGNSLDLNAIHNQAITRTVNPAAGGRDGYFRNEGVGSWELNLAAFLADLNTNIWGQDVGATASFYQYNEPYSFNFNRGVAFEDALSLLSYRYGYNYNLLSALPANSYTALQNAAYDGVDSFTVGNLLTNTTLPVAAFPTVSTTPWAGSDNTNHFFALTSELYDASKSSVFFTNRLQLAGTGAATYDRYTFYRLLEQLGTESEPDSGKLNLNYRNVTNGVVVTGMETNFYAWAPLEFFTNAADRMLRAATAEWVTNYVTLNPRRSFVATFNVTNSFGIGRIPVLVSNEFVYTPAVNRLLQLAANIYDATTNASAFDANGHDFPHVFRPTFHVVTENGFRNVYINGYEEVSSLGALTIGAAPLDPPIDVSVLPLGNTAGLLNSQGNVYGVPWIIGAKKGFPNFNQFHMRNAAQVTRKLQVRRANPLLPGALETNQMFVMSITNQLGFSFWNSYDTNYVSAQLGGIKVVIRDELSMVLSNSANPNIVNKSQVYSPNFSFTTWPGSAWSSSTLNWNEKLPATNSFANIVWNFPFLPESIFRAGLNIFEPVNSPTAPLWELGNTEVPVFPHFGLMTTNWLQAYILDGNHVIDYVQFNGPRGTRNLNNEIADPDSIAGGTLYMWSTNVFGSGAAATPTWGVVNQLSVSRKGNPPFVNSWKKPTNLPSDMSTIAAEAAFFDGFFTPTYGYVNSKGQFLVARNTNLVQQAPYTPSRTAYEYNLWQVNDPLVHYLASDLNTANTNARGHSDDLLLTALPFPSMTTPTERYQPWGRNAQMLGGGLGATKVDVNAYNIAFRDSLVWGSDFWEFPGGKLPAAGWLGRVHRGTPWQTVFLKATNVLAEPVLALNGEPIGTNTWQYWTGDINNSFDAANSAPVTDAALFDLFTTSFNGNATRGTLSVNQSGLAAWSALFSGVVALQNITDTVEIPSATTTPIITNTIIQPAGVDAANSALWNLVTNINATRQTFTNPNGLAGAFTRVGDILQVPALTQDSPFLNRSTSDHLQYDISDALYEWLPQQTLGLLRVGTPRYVIYCYGQTLKPAPNGTVLGAVNFGLVTNYQVVAESAARAVIRVDEPAGEAPRITVESYNVLPPD